jgi:hypothetical protein
MQLYHVKPTYNNTTLTNKSAINKYSICSTVKSSWMITVIALYNHCRQALLNQIHAPYFIQTQFTNCPFCKISVKKAKLNIHNLPTLIPNFKHPATDSNDLQ